EALGRAQFHARQYGQAMETLLRLTTESDYSCPAWVHTMLGDCYMALERPRDAREAYNAAKKLKPSSPGVWVNLAKAALTIGDVPRAVLAGQEALRLDSRSLDAVMLVGYALVCDKQLERAVVLLAGATATFPDSGMLQCLLGRAYDAAGQGAKAARCYAAALKLEPDNPLARELLGGAEDTPPARPE
ncbi:MAG: tetratricopeptide repeat protein, partial [Phycisphaerae bacterium]|nr:tetratricopeptide repeat protein [Phycisphaerae bacterium]